MKTMNIVLSIALLQVLAWYGYANSMTENGFILQGYIGTVLPVVCGALLFAYGRISAPVQS